MKIAIIGSIQYAEQINKYVKDLAVQGHRVRVPIFDYHPPECNELWICEQNRFTIEWAEEIHIFWDGRSIGTIFDMGMAFALKKKVKVVHLGKKSFINFLKLWEEKIDNDLELSNLKTSEG